MATEKILQMIQLKIEVFACGRRWDVFGDDGVPCTLQTSASFCGFSFKMVSWFLGVRPHFWKALARSYPVAHFKFCLSRMHGIELNLRVNQTQICTVLSSNNSPKTVTCFKFHSKQPLRCRMSRYVTFTVCQAGQRLDSVKFSFGGNPWKILSLPFPFRLWFENFLLRFKEKFFCIPLHITSE